MKCLFRLVVIASLSFVLLGADADNLFQVYQEALQSDPTFKRADADWLVAKQNLPLAMTGNGSPGSGLFPNISLTSTFGKTYLVSGNTQSTIYGVAITQPIFNLQTWESIRSASFLVKAATARYLSAGQDLMNRVAIAYFEVLRAHEKLNLTQVQKKQFFHEYQTAQREYEVGVIAITPMYDAKSKYDQSLASEIRDQNNVQNALNKLAAITGKHYASLSSLQAKIPLLIPKPRRLEDWSSLSEKQNYVLQADLNTMLSYQQNIKAAQAGLAPTVNFLGSYQNGDTTTTMPIATGVADPEQTQVGLNLTFPVFRGGYDEVNIKQARYQYLSASDQLEVDHRQVVNQTQQSYLGVESGISQINADHRAIISAQKQLSATKQGYEVGTRTMVDVLDSVTNLTLVQQTYADDRYNYIESILGLKQQAGMLSPEDLQMISSWLGKPVFF